MKKWLLLVLFALAVGVRAAPLWQIGGEGEGNAGLALAPGHFDSYRNDGYFVVGSSEAKLDWPYVHPGPDDGWAGGGEHTFTVVFGLAAAGASGDCKLTLDLLDTHYRSPPRLRIDINGQPFERELPVGGNGDAVRGLLAHGKPHRLEVVFPATLLKAGTNQVNLTTLAGSWMLYRRVALEGPSELKLAPVANATALLQEARRTPGQVEQVIVVFKTHFDIGYTDLASNVINRYRTTMIDKALDIIDASRARPQNEQFVWTVPGWPLQQILWPGQTPERRARVLRALKEGRLAVHALPFSLETESLDVEDIVRGLHFSADLARENGLPLPRAAKMTDVPEHTWAMATILKHAGIDFLHIGCNGGSAYPRVPPLFWWEGPDGSRLLTAYSINYGTNLRPPRNWPHRTWLAMLMTGDNHGPPSPQEVDAVLQRAARELPGVKIKFGRLEDFADAILAEKPELPVVRADMPDTWIHGLMAMPQDSQLARDVRPLEPALELLDTQLHAAGLNPPPVKRLLADAFEHSLLYGEHTWGLFGSSPGGFWYGEDWKQARAAGKYTRFERSFDDHRDYIRRTAQFVTNALAERLTLLAQNVAVEGRRIVVFNPLPWPRSALVAAQVPGPLGPLTDCATGQTVPIEATGGTSVRFLAADVPANGYKTFTLPAQSQREPGSSASPFSGQTLENEFFKLTFDTARGGIASLVEKQTGRELVATQDARALGEYLFEQFDAEHVRGFLKTYPRGSGGWVANDFGKPNLPGTNVLRYAAVTLTNCTLSIQHGTLADVATLQCADATPLAKAVALRVTLERGTPSVDLEWSVVEKTPNPVPEGGWLCLPFALAQPHFQIGRPGSLIDPARDIVAGANRYLMAVASGVTITGDDGFGVGVCALDAPLMSFGEPGLWKFDYDFVPQRARVFINLHNNEWNTNFPLWQEGSWRSRVRLWVVRRGGDAEQNLLTPAWEARLPLLTAYAVGPRGKQPVSASGLTLSRRGILVTAFGGDLYGAQTLLRLWEQAGKAGDCVVQLPAGCPAAQALPVNLRGEPAGAPLPIRNHAFTVHLDAFAPASFVLEGLR